MRKITITFTEEDKYVRCFIDFGSSDDGTRHENEMANEAQPLIRAALMHVRPSQLSGVGHGDTEEEATIMARLQRELNELNEDV